MSLNHKRRIFRSSFSLTRGLSDRRLGRGAVFGLVAVIGLAGMAAAAHWWGVSPALPGFMASWDARAVGQAPTGRMVADSSHVAVVDGTTLRLVDQVVRLDGVIAPVRGETCRARDGSVFDCGVAAANALAAMLRQGTVDCTLLGADGNGHPRAVCSAGGEMLNRAVVAQGWARASDDSLLPAERNARAEQRGVWAMAR